MMFRFNEKGIYVCCDCGEPYAVGHNLRCSKQPKKCSSGKLVKPQNVGQQIADGMEIIHAAEYLEE